MSDLSRVDNLLEVEVVGKWLELILLRASPMLSLASLPIDNGLDMEIDSPEESLSDSPEKTDQHTTTGHGHKLPNYW